MGVEMRRVAHTHSVTVEQHASRQAGTRQTHTHGDQWFRKHFRRLRYSIPTYLPILLGCTQPGPYDCLPRTPHLLGTVRWSNFDRRDPKMEVFLQSTEATPWGYLLTWMLTPRKPPVDTMFMAAMAMVLPWKFVEDLQSFVRNTKHWH